MYQFITRHLKSAGLRQSLVVTAGNYFGTILSAVALILLSRMLGPESFGVFSAAFALSLLISRIFDLGMGMALQRQLAQEASEHGAKQKTTNIVQAITIVRAVTAIVLVIAGWVLGPWIGYAILHIQNPLIIQISISSVGVSMGFDLITYIYQAYQQFLHSSLLVILQAGIKLLGAVLLLVTHQANALTSLLLYNLAPLSGVIWGLWEFRTSIFTPIRNTFKDLSIIKPVAKWGSVAIISAAFAEQIDVLFIQAMLTSHDTGLYAAASRIAMFMSLIGLSLGTVLSIRVARYHDKAHLDAYLKKAWLLSIGCILLTLIAIPFGSIAIHFTVGSAYNGAVMPLSLLLIATALSSAASPYTALFYLFDKPQYYSISGILTMVILIVGDLILIPQSGLFGAGLAKIITRAIVLVFTFWYVHTSYQQHTTNKNHG